MTKNDHLQNFATFIEANGNSPNVCAMYYKRVRTFLEKRPDATGAGKSELRQIIDDYIDSLPVTSGLDVTKTAVRYYWTMRFGEPYHPRFRFADQETNDAIEAECADFREYLLATQTLSEGTIKGRVNKVKRFLYAEFGQAPFTPDLVDLESVLDYLARFCKGLSASTKRGYRTEIRAYAAFINDKGYTKSAGRILAMDLTPPLPTEPLPNVITDADYRSLTESVDPSKPRGKRDLAMILLMGNLGLRACDVALLTLDGVDWANGILRIRDSKSISDRSLPLDEETGFALQDYVINARSSDPGPTRALFLPMGQEERGERMSFGQVRRAIALCAQKAGIELGGPHSLRRTAATNMVNAGVAIKPIADILGHESIMTTMGYLRVDLESMRKLAAPWPREVKA